MQMPLYDWVLNPAANKKVSTGALAAIGFFLESLCPFGYSCIIEFP
jgi:hypothetical protein